MAGVNVPGSSYKPLQTIVPVAGSIIGGMFGGPGGAMAGQKIGEGLTKSGPDPGAVQQSASATSPIGRRIAATEDHPAMQLAQADAALKKLSPEDQAKYGPTIAAARQMENQGAP